MGRVEAISGIKPPPPRPHVIQGLLTLVIKVGEVFSGWLRGTSIDMHQTPDSFYAPPYSGYDSGSGGR